MTTRSGERRGHAPPSPRHLRARPRTRAAAQGRRRPGGPPPALLRLRPHAAGRRARPPLRARRGRVRAVPPAAPRRARAHADRPAHGARADGPAAGARRRVDSRPVDPLITEVTIARPREEVWEYLADIANHAEFTDHFLVDWRLTREDTYGVGAGARWKSKAPMNRFPWGDSTIVEAERPRRIVVVGRTGKYNRNRTIGVYELERTSGAGTRVRYTYSSEPKLPSDRFLERIGGGWAKRSH